MGKVRKLNFVETRSHSTRSNIQRKVRKLNFVKTRSHSTRSNIQRKCKMHNVFISIWSGESWLHHTTSHEINKEHLRLLISHGYFMIRGAFNFNGCKKLAKNSFNNILAMKISVVFEFNSTSSSSADANVGTNVVTS